MNSPRFDRRSRLFLPLAGIALAAGLALPGVAAAQGIPEAGIQGTVFEPWTDESSWDIPDTIVIDGRDDLEESDLRSIETGYGIQLRPTDLEKETRIELST